MRRGAADGFFQTRLNLGRNYSQWMSISKGIREADSREWPPN
jgi:hypothetical protein